MSCRNVRVQYRDLMWAVLLVRAHIHPHEQHNFHMVIDIFSLGKKNVTDFQHSALLAYNGCWISKWHLDFTEPLKRRALLANKSKWFMGASISALCAWVCYVAKKKSLHICLQMVNSISLHLVRKQFWDITVFSSQHASCSYKDTIMSEDFWFFMKHVKIRY